MLNRLLLILKFVKENSISKIVKLVLLRAEKKFKKN